MIHNVISLRKRTNKIVTIVLFPRRRIQRATNKQTNVIVAIIHKELVSLV